MFKKKSSYWHANRTPLPTLSAMIGGALTILVFYCLEKPHIGFKRGRVGTSTLEFNIFNALLSKQPTTDCICIIAELPHDARRCTMASGFRAFTLTPTLNWFFAIYQLRDTSLWDPYLLFIVNELARQLIFCDSVLVDVINLFDPCYFSIFE